MNTLRISILLMLSLLWACGGESTEQSDEENETTETSTEEETDKASDEEAAAEDNEAVSAEEETDESNFIMEDDIAEASLVGKWALEGEPEGEEYLMHDFLFELEYKAGAVGLAMTGSYKVEDGFLLIEATIDEGYGMDNKAVSEKFQILEITEEMPYLLKLKDTEGNIWVYKLEESYGD